MDAFIGSILPMAFSFAPVNWMSCEGQLLPISSYQALFALIGTMYGGNGTTNFQLPDLRGRIIKGQGTGPGLPHYNVGQKGGTENVTLTVQNLPAHNHAITVNANGNSSTSNDPTNNYFGGNGPLVYETTKDGTVMNTGAITATNTGNGVPFGILNPYLAMYYNICVQGYFPSRN